MTGKRKHNDDERAQRIDNDEGLYDRWKTTRPAKAGLHPRAHAPRSPRD